MNKTITFIIGSLLLVNTVGCENPAKTSVEAPDTVQTSPNAPDAKPVGETREDAGSELRRKQLNADIKAREQRNNITGGDKDRAEGDLQSEVRSKIEANIRGSQLAINANEQGGVVISGTVPKAADKANVDNLAKQIKGVKTVDSTKVVVVPAAK